MLIINKAKIFTEKLFNCHINNFGKNSFFEMLSKVMDFDTLSYRRLIVFYRIVYKAFFKI